MHAVDTTIIITSFTYLRMHTDDKVVTRLLQGYEKVKLNSLYSLANFSGHWFQGVDIASKVTTLVIAMHSTCIEVNMYTFILHINAWVLTYMYQLHLLLCSFNLVYIASQLSISIHCRAQFYILTRLWMYCITLWQGCCKVVDSIQTCHKIVRTSQCRQPCGNLDFYMGNF